MPKLSWGVFVTALALAVGILPMAASQAAPGAKAFRSCVQLRAQFPEGVARDAAAADAGVTRWLMRPVVNAALYARNATRLDTNKDGIACEVKGPREAGPLTSDWVETDWCASRASLADLAATYDPKNPRPTLLEVAKRRYPPATAVIERASDERLQAWLRPSPGDPNDFENLLGSFSTVVHEEGHMLDLSLGSQAEFVYRIVDDASIVRVPTVETFARAEILRVHPDLSIDLYAQTYLKSAGSNQDVEILVEEFVQYVHSLASDYCAFELPRNLTVSSRDGALTFMWWMEMYLAVGRQYFPGDYAEILANKPLVSVILDTWDRSEYWLLKTRGTRYGNDLSKMSRFVYDPKNLAEIDVLREARV